jgi:hypothetical protein
VVAVAEVETEQHHLTTEPLQIKQILQIGRATVMLAATPEVVVQMVAVVAVVLAAQDLMVIH